MNIYKLEWSWYEENLSFLFSHLEKKTQEEFNSDCSLAFQKAGLKLLEKEHFSDMIEWVSIASEEMLSLGYERYEPISLSIDGEILVIHDEPEIDIAFFPEINTSKEDFLGADTCIKIKEKFMNYHKKMNEKLKDLYDEKNDTHKQDKETSNES